MKLKIKRTTAALTAAVMFGSLMLNFPNEKLFVTGEMKAAASAEGIAIDAANFPDENFRAYVDEKFDELNDDVLSIEERAEVTIIRAFSMGITDLTGIEYFPNLETLHCYGNSLTALDISNNSVLEVLWCNSNSLKKLDVSQNLRLSELHCNNNMLTELDLSNNTDLTDLNCSENQLSKLDLSTNTLLESLHCSSNQITELIINHNRALKALNCENNQIDSLDMSDYPELWLLSCGSNPLNKLKVENDTKLESLRCSFGRLTSLDISDCPILVESTLNFGCVGNEYTISLTDGTFDLSELHGEFDVTKASEWVNAAVEGNLLTIINPALEITYKYNVGFDELVAFTLLPESCSLAEATVSEISDRTYTGSAIEPHPIVKVGDVFLEEGEDYVLSYENNVNPGTATVIITSMGDFFTGSITVNFNIVMDETDITTATTTTTTAITTTTTTTTSTTTTTATTEPETTTSTTTTTTTTAPTTSGEVVYGDADGDNAVKMADVIRVMLYSCNAKLYALSAEAQNNCDVYQRGDGVDLSDALSIQKRIAQVIKMLPES